MSRPPPQSYLLRLWREQPDAPVRATLIAMAQPATPQHFVTLDGLFTFLHAQADLIAATAALEVHQAPEWNHIHCTPDDRQ